MTNSRRDPFISELRQRFGAPGVDAWFNLVEYIAEQMNPPDFRPRVVATPQTLAQECFCDDKLLTKVMQMAARTRPRAKLKWRKRATRWTVEIPKLLAFKDEYTERELRKSRESPDKDGTGSGNRSDTDTETDIDKEKEQKQRGDRDGIEYSATRLAGVYANYVQGAQDGRVVKRHVLAALKRGINGHDIETAFMHKDNEGRDCWDILKALGNSKKAADNLEDFEGAAERRAEEIRRKFAGDQG